MKELELTIEKLEKYESKVGAICIIVNDKYRTVYNGEKVGDTLKYRIFKDNIICFISDYDKTTI